MKTAMIVNLSDAQQKRNLLEMVRALEGPHRVEICRHRPRRSDRQNRYYWPCFVQPFAEFLRAQGEFVTDDEAHCFFKEMFLRRDVVDPRTGEVIGQTIRSTTDLDTSEFNAYLEGCAQWLAEKIGIIVPEPDTYMEKDSSNEPESSVTHGASDPRSAAKVPSQPNRHQRVRTCDQLPVQVG